MKAMLKFIPSEVFGNAEFKVNMDGSVDFKYNDVGDSNKFLIGNDHYFNWLKKNAPLPVRPLLSTLLANNHWYSLFKLGRSLDKIV